MNFMHTAFNIIFYFMIRVVFYESANKAKIYDFDIKIDFSDFEICDLWVQFIIFVNPNKSLWAPPFLWVQNSGNPQNHNEVVCSLAWTKKAAA